ncbi:MAG: thiol:disulfide interchange protein [Flavobacteriaceae bacterium]|nr:MAG: thiol:disulfide interchange protein [Flavobacteriaceae bacterium]
MHKIIKGAFIFITLFGFGLQAQHSISGNFTPAQNFKWVVAYQLKSGSLAYVADAAVKNGVFKLNIKDAAEPGTYRLVYGIPQEELYFDVIYNGKEDVQLIFDETKGVTFIASKENKLFTNYFKEVNICEQEIISLFSANNFNTSELQQLVQSLEQIQSDYEKKSADLICHDYIIANNPYVPALTESAQEYVSNKKGAYFKKVNFKNIVLQNSDFLMDKTINYVLTAMPLQQLTDNELEKVRQENISTVYGLLQNADASYATHFLYTLWNKLAILNLNETTDFMYNTYLEKLAIKTNNQKVIDNIVTHNRLRLGATAPEIIWKDGDTDKKLSELEAAEHYVLVFWSSGCPHCLKEVPQLHKGLLEIPTTKVLAIGLEDNDTKWKKEIGKLNEFHHALALGKWENKYVGIYGIQTTPTYFILDKDKKIVAKPSDYTGVITYLKP